MIRPSLLGIVLLSASIPQIFAQQYYLPTGEYNASPTGLSPTQIFVTPDSGVPSQLVAPAVPYTTPYAPQYPMQYPASYPVANGTPYTTVPSVPYPAPYTAPYATPGTVPSAAPNTAQYTTPYPTNVQQPYEPSSNVYSSAPYRVPYASTYPATQPTVSETPSLPQSAVLPADTSVAPTAEPAATEEPTSPKAGEGEGEEAVLVEEEIATEWYHLPSLWFDPWEGNVEIGISGSDGNTQTLNYLLGLDAKRETEDDILKFDVAYDRKSADSVETAHRLFSEIRWELLFKDSAWTWFFHETTEYDEFKAFDVRLSYDTGLGRRLIKSEMTSLLARVGAGTSHEIGGSNDNLIPEAVFGLEFSHELNERQKLSASSEYSPDVTDFLDYRLRSKASWEVVLDEETNLSLKVSILDRYDSTPDGKRPNDLDYTLTLLWNF